MNRRTFLSAGLAVAIIPPGKIKKKKKPYSLTAEVLKVQYKDYEETRAAVRDMFKNSALMKIMIARHMENIT